MIERIKDNRKVVPTYEFEMISKINEIIDLLEEKFPEEAEPELKPCPFCGEVPKTPHKRNDGAFKVCCINEECTTNPDTARYGTAKEAIEAWNRRAGYGQAD